MQRDDDFDIYAMSHSGVLLLYADRGVIDMAPDYQREGGIWPLEKRQLLVDTILNGFDLPKIYFHKLPVASRGSKRGNKFAVVDGKQRLESIWGFIDGEFPLAPDFKYIKDKSVDLGGLTYQELARAHPTLKSLFDSSALPIWVIDTADLDTIEELFSRLNEAVSLNAPEKRNAFGGPLPACIREVEKHKVLTKLVPIKNSRYKHRDLAAKFLWLEHAGEVRDTKKARLDQFVKDARQWKNGSAQARELRAKAEKTLDIMASGFRQNDPLLRSVGMVTLYFAFALKRKQQDKPFPKRRTLQEFEDIRQRNKERAETEPESDDIELDLLEFDRLAQSPNDAVAIKFKLDVLEAFLDRQR